MNYTEVKNKIDLKAAELHKVEAEHVRLVAAHKAAEAEHVEALVAAEMEAPGAVGRLRKAEAELHKIGKAVDESFERYKTLRTVTGRMGQEARGLRRSELLKLREEKAVALITLAAPKYERAIREVVIPIVREAEGLLDDIQQIENELEGLVAPDKLRRASLESPHWVSVDLANILVFARQVAVLNAQRLDGMKQEPVVPAAAR